MTDIVERLRSGEDGLEYAAADEIERLRLACTKMNTEVCQRLGKALGYPWFKDDQENFPGATEENGVCTGEHVAESLAAEAADEIERLRAERDEAKADLELRRCCLAFARRDRDRAMAEGDRLREAVQVLIANADMHQVVRAAALDIARAALGGDAHD